MTIRSRYAYIAFASFGSVILGIALGRPWLLPILNAAFVWPLFARNVRLERRVDALQEMLFWALSMSVAVIAMSFAFPDLSARAIYRSTSYAAEMFQWVRTGTGPEASPSIFVPMHLRHLLIFAALTLVSAGFFGLVMGAVLLNYMNYYVGTLFTHATDPIAVVLFGWPIWSIVRVVGYILLAIPLTELTLAVILRRPVYRQGVLTFGLIALGLLAADLVLKATLADTWQTVLHSATNL